MQPFWQALYDYGADVVLNGHEHDYERFAPQTPTGAADNARGIREFVIGTGGASETGYTFGTPLPNSEVRATDAIGVLKLTLSPTGYDWNFLAAPGTTLSDSGHGDCVGANARPTVDAGPDQTITLPGDATLAGSVNDDGLPTGANVTSTWTKVDGPGNVTFADPSQPATSATFSAAGTSRLRLTADDTALTGNDEIVVTVNPAVPSNVAPVANAGPDQTITLPGDATLAGTVNDDGLPAGATVTSTWTKVSGPGTVTFADPSKPATTAAFSAAGSYTLRLTADDTALTSSDEIVITVNPAAPTNQAPTVDAGPDQSLTLPDGATLAGTVNDDGLPTGATVTSTWTKVSGPGTVTFADATKPATTATFSAAGSYTLRLTANDTALTSNDEIVITVLLPDLIFGNGFESGNLAGWSSSTTDGGNLSVTSAAALAGTFGMQALINDNNRMFVQDDSPSAESRYRARFMFDPHGIKMAKNDQHVLFACLNASGVVVAQIELRYNGGYQIRGAQAPDGKSPVNTGWTTISNSRHSIEIDWQAASAAGANNGALALWIDGVQKAAVTGIDNDTRRVESMQLGAVSGIDSGTRGTYYFDAFESRRRTYIGP